MSGGVRIGLDVWQQGLSIAELHEIWAAADDSDLDNLWMFDHFKPLSPDPVLPVFEAWTLLAAMAEATQRIRIGVMVSGNTYRHPAVLAKMAVTVDALSVGRLEFGLGAGHHPDEHTMFGIPYARDRQRLLALREACEVIKRLWTEDGTSFEGDHYRLEQATSRPRPVQSPYPPVWIGGEGEKLTLRVVAEHADVWNAVGHGSVSELHRKLAVLDAHCADVGRDPTTLRRSVQVHLDRVEDLAGTVARMRALHDIGFSDFVVIVPGAEPMPRVRQCLDVIVPEFQGG